MGFVFGGFADSNEVRKIWQCSAAAERRTEVASIRRLEPAVEIEELREGQLPVRKEVRGEDLLAGQRRVNKIFADLELRDLDRLSLRIDVPDLGDARFGVQIELCGTVVRGRGEGQNLNGKVRDAGDEVLSDDLGARVGDKDEVRLHGCILT